MTEADENYLERLFDEYCGMDAGPEKLAAMQRSVEAADAVGDMSWRMANRLNLFQDTLAYGDGANAVSTAEELLALFLAEPSERFLDNCLEVFSAAAGLWPDLPQLTNDRWEALMDSFARVVRLFERGYSAYWLRRCVRMQELGRDREAEDAYENLRASLSDPFPRCDACTAYFAALYLLNAGRYDDALQAAEPVLTGRLRCSQEPRRTAALLLSHALDTCSWHEIREHALRLTPILKGAGSGAYEESMVRFLTCVNPSAAVEMFQNGFAAFYGQWPKGEVFRLCRAGFVLFGRLADMGNDPLSLRFPERFPLYSEKGVYDPETLAAWFHSEAAALAEAFDARDGGTRFDALMQNAAHIRDIPRN